MAIKNSGGLFSFLQSGDSRKTGTIKKVEVSNGKVTASVAVLPFDADFARTSPEVFVQKVLIEACNAKGVVVGPDFHFGHRRSGNAATDKL